MRVGDFRSGLSPGRGTSGGSKTARSPQALRREGRADRTRKRTNGKLRHYPRPLPSLSYRLPHDREIGERGISMAGDSKRSERNTFFPNGERERVGSEHRPPDGAPS